METIQKDEVKVVVLDRTPIDVATQQDIVDTVAERLADGHGGILVTPNLDHMWMLHKNKMMQEAYAGADIRVADGMPLVWAAKLAGQPLPERVCGSDLLFSLSAMAAANGVPVFYVGGQPGAADATAAKMANDYGTVNAGALSPALPNTPDDNALQMLNAVVTSAEPAIVFLALGSPKQEQYANALRARNDRNWYVCVGGSFEFAADMLTRAPERYQKMGLEWVYRLRQEPGRLFKRYIVHDMPFAFLLFGKSALYRIRRRGK